MSVIDDLKLVDPAWRETGKDRYAHSGIGMIGCDLEDRWWWVPGGRGARDLRGPFKSAVEAAEHAKKRSNGR